jgi:hypothetical protein
MMVRDWNQSPYAAPEAAARKFVELAASIKVKNRSQRWSVSFELGTKTPGGSHLT